MRTKKIAVLLTCAAGVFTAWAAFAQQARKIDDTTLRTAGKTGEEWLSYGLTPQETRYSPLKQIDATNVSRLGLAWSTNLPVAPIAPGGRGGGNQEATPLYSNGALYSITNWSVVFAIDARTGKEKWHWDPEVNQPAVQPKICCGVVNRGVALYENLVIAPVIDGHLVALDQETGKPVWETRVSYAQDSYTVTMAPRIAKGKVIIGVAGAEYPVRGYFEAHDAKTGQFAWRFYTTPGDPSKPFESEAMRKASATWDKDAWKMGGGATVWDGMAYDPDLNLFYVGTGNGGPWPEELRKSKGLDNLYVASVLAVNPDNGELKWYFQMVPGDSWDYDSVQQLMLADITIKGQPRKVIMQANKNGFYYVIDRASGKFIAGQPFSTVTWAKGLDEATGRPIVNAEAHYGAESINISPGPGGAHNWSPMSFNPATGLVYIPTSFGGGNYAIQENFVYKPGATNMGISFGNFGGGAGRGGPGAPPAAGRGPGTNVSPEVAAAAAAAAAAPTPPPAAPPKPAGAARPSPPAIGPTGRGGMLIAYDPVAGKERWRSEGGGSIGGGTVSTAGNLVLQVVPDGRLVAFSADKGDKLFEVKTGLTGGLSPPITYILDGKQYVTLMGNISSGGFGAPPPPPPAGGAGGAPGAATPAGVAPAGAPAGGPPPAGGAGFGAPPPGGFGAAAPTPPTPPKILTFVLDGKAPLPGPR